MMRRSACLDGRRSYEIQRAVDRAITALRPRCAGKRKTYDDQPLNHSYSDDEDSLRFALYPRLWLHTECGPFEDVVSLAGRMIFGWKWLWTGHCLGLGLPLSDRPLPLLCLHHHIDCLKMR